MVLLQAEVQFLEGRNYISTQFRGCGCVIDIQERKGAIHDVGGEPMWEEIGMSAVSSSI